MFESLPRIIRLLPLLSTVTSFNTQVSPRYTPFIPFTFSRTRTRHNQPQKRIIVLHQAAINRSLQEARPKIGPDIRQIRIERNSLALHTGALVIEIVRSARARTILQRVRDDGQDIGPGEVLAARDGEVGGVVAERDAEALGGGGGGRARDGEEAGGGDDDGVCGGGGGGFRGRDRGGFGAGDDLRVGVGVAVAVAGAVGGGARAAIGVGNETIRGGEVSGLKDLC